MFLGVRGRTTGFDALFVEAHYFLLLQPKLLPGWHNRNMQSISKFLETRRSFLRTAIGGLGFATVGGYSFFFEPHSPVVEQVEIFLPRLPEQFNGFKIVQLSDLHYGPHISTADLTGVVEATNELQPDLTVITGDFVSVPLFGDPSRARKDAEPCASVLAGLSARAGRFAVLGNHDHSAGADWVATPLNLIGIAVLRNRAVPIESNQARLWVAGVDDVLTHGADLQRALEQVPKNEPTVLLAHEPDYADHVARFNVDLQLSGHSHGGQVRLPLLGAPILPAMARKYPIGLRRVGPLHLYSNRGIGVIDPPARFNCPPEITLLTLRSRA
jgi:predicted MPP superfamily phosphohydrolase